MKFQRRGASLIGVLIAVAAIGLMVWMLSSTLTGTANSPGVKQRTDRTIELINLRGLHQGFVAWSMDYRDAQYPSTKIIGNMESDTTHAVFKVLLESGVIAGQQLISPNEYQSDFEVGYAGSFGPHNTSFALPDYDADNWLRHRMWRDTKDSSSPLVSDRLVDDPYAPEIQTVNDTFWYVLFNDGHSENLSEPVLRNGDSLFEYDSRYGDQDALMVHD